MAAIVVTATVAFVMLTYRQFESVLYESNGERLRSSSQLLAQMFSDAIPVTRTQLSALASEPSVRRFLGAPERDLPDSAAFAGMLPRQLDSTRVRLRLVDATGLVRAEIRGTDAVLAPSWAEERIAARALSPVNLAVSPLRGAGDLAQYEIVMPVHADDGGERLLGYYVETRVVRARGVDAIRRLTGSSTLLLGQTEGDLWSDLERVSAGPPTIAAMDSILIFDTSPRGPGLGVAQAVRGTPWVVWLQMTRGQALAPIDDLLRLFLPLAFVVAGIGTLAAWLLGRRLSKRITRLARQMQRRNPSATAGAAPSDLNDPSPGRGARDEVEQLEDAFQAMSARADRHAEVEAKVMQSQQLEAVGRLAGGIAHDFNNMLTVVSNYGEMIAAKLPAGSESARDMDEVLHATERASRLTRQLLAFSRRQVLQPVSLDLNGVVIAAHRMLERLIPSNVQVVRELAPDLSPVLADPGQLEQVLVNLALNAADAMPDGGRLTFATRHAELDEAPPDATAPSTGIRHYVQLSVRDTGHGMDRETAARAFEPFFSTKRMGKGTGLGLASVHGIVTQLDGRIWLYSEPGTGTVVKILLPVTTGAPTAPPRPERRARPRSGHGTILLVEDDPATREVTRRLLQAHGYLVEVVDSAPLALEHLAAGSTLPTLVLTDVMMPVMTGVELGDRLAKDHPGLPVLLMSGYADAQVEGPRSGGVRRPLIEKPFTSTALLMAIERTVDGANATR